VSESTPPTDDAVPAAPEPSGPPTGPRSPLLVVVALIALAESLALLAYTIGIALSGLQNPGSVAAPPVEVVIYLLFGVGVFLVARGLWLRRRWARTPFIVVQLFGLVTAYTLLSGDGADVHVLGWIVGAVSIVGGVLALNRRVADSLA